MKKTITTIFFLFIISLFYMGCIWGGSGGNEEKPDKQNTPNPERIEPERKPHEEIQPPEVTTPEVSSSFNDTVQIN